MIFGMFIARLWLFGIALGIAGLAVPLFALAGPSQSERLPEWDTSEQICDFLGAKLPPKAAAFQSNEEAEEIVRKIVEASGLAKNFTVGAAGVPNAAALIIGETRYIIYNPSFITQMGQLVPNRWASTSVLAHEIGHHLNGHTLSSIGSIPHRELEADFFSGFVLQRLGGSPDDAKAVMKKIASEVGSATHPARPDRLDAIDRGWATACALEKACKMPPALAGLKKGLDDANTVQQAGSLLPEIRRGSISFTSEDTARAGGGIVFQMEDAPR